VNRVALTAAVGLSVLLVAFVAAGIADDVVIKQIQPEHPKPPPGGQPTPEQPKVQPQPTSSSPSTPWGVSGPIQPIAGDYQFGYALRQANLSAAQVEQIQPILAEISKGFDAYNANYTQKMTTLGAKYRCAVAAAQKAGDKAPNEHEAVKAAGTELARLADEFEQDRGKRHDDFFAKAARILSAEQLEQVKDAFDIHGKDPAVRDPAMARVTLREMTRGITLTAAQRTEIAAKLQKLMQEHRGELADIQKAAAEKTDQYTEMMKRYAAATIRFTKARDELLDSQLSADQKKTLDALRTAEGRRSAEATINSAASRLAGLSLTDDQKKKLDELKAAAVEALIPLFRNSANPENTHAIPPLLEQFRKDTDDVLTADQRAKLSQPVRAPDSKLPG